MPISTSQFDPPTLALHPALERLAVRMLPSWATATDWNDFAGLAITALLAELPASHIGMARAASGQWKWIVNVGSAARCDQPLLADALDSQTVRHFGAWWATTLAGQSRESDVVAVQFVDDTVNPDRRHLLESIAAYLSLARQAIQDRVTREERCQRAEAILQIVASWNQNLDMELLLREMAETAIDLFASERATIFLWDRRTRTVVGRPALGVESQELRFPEDKGIVGQVLQSGTSRRVDRGPDETEIYREVDKQLNFQTQTLLCVPLRDHKGKMLGAFELINKRHGNFTDADQQGLEELAVHAAGALANTQQYSKLLESRRQIADEAAQHVQMIGQSVPIQELRERIERVAATDLAVLILGENGTGKEVAGRRVHLLSPRRHEPFIAVNCAALTETLLESELFGHEQGAFTDAREMRRGKFELASGGTLFLDEIGDMPLSGQAKLLRVLEEKIVVRIGGATPIPVDTRVLAATNQDLAAMVRDRRFREDLFFRLNVVTLDMPPLRDRPEDVLPLAEFFLHQYCAKAHRAAFTLTAAAKKKLQQHAWPGNVREIRNMMERLAYLATTDEIDAGDLPFVQHEPDNPLELLNEPLAEATQRFQMQYIQAHVARARGNMSEAARQLGLHRSNLYRKMRQLGMPTSDEREE